MLLDTVGIVVVVAGAAGNEVVIMVLGDGEGGWLEGREARRRRGWAPRSGNS